MLSAEIEHLFKHFFNVIHKLNIIFLKCLCKSQAISNCRQFENGSHVVSVNHNNAHRHSAIFKGNGLQTY